MGIDVSGKDAPAKLKALALGEAPAGSGKTKLAVGKPGADGVVNIWWWFPEPGARDQPGQPGWSAEAHPDEMHGEPGKPGLAGNHAGSINIYCGDLTGTTLTLRANGGKAQDGQDGQAGAKRGIWRQRR